MPGMNGVQTLNAIRQRRPESMVVMMTAYTLPGLIKKAQEDGALATLPKPIDMGKLLAFLHEFRRSRTVLVVDDDIAFCETLTDALKAHGYDVAYTTDAHGAPQVGLGRRREQDE